MDEHILASVVIDRGENRKGKFIPPTKKRSLSPFFENLRKKRKTFCQTEESKKDGSNLKKESNKEADVVTALVSNEKSENSSSTPSQQNIEEEKCYQNDKLECERKRKYQFPQSETRTSSVSVEVSKDTLDSYEDIKLRSENDQEDTSSQSSVSSTIFYSVLWAKASTRKHKKWEADGLLIVSSKSVILKSLTGKVLDSSSNYKMDSDTFDDGKVIKLGSKEIEIQERLKTNPLSTKVEVQPMQVSQQITKLPTRLISRPFVLPCAPRNEEKPNADASKPLFDPTAPDALVLPQLESDETVNVVVDPHLSRHLRDHQREGVIFLYKCVMGRYIHGAILADEMGLGKTLQCITLLWTIMKQTAYGRKNVVKRSLIVTPSSLVTNWEKEFYRWLGNERIRVYTVNADHPLKHYPPQCPVLIISYDMATRSEDGLRRMKFDLMICDEAHKIKNSNGQAYSLLYNFSCEKRILLTGTPIQNDLMELYSLVDFANPGVLGKDYEFRKNFDKPISKFQERNPLTTEAQCFEAIQLNSELTKFFLRRGLDVMTRYLPPKVTAVVICKPTELQKALYIKLLSSKFVEDIGFGNSQSSLSLILALKKICNHPSLVHPKNQASEDVSLYNELSSIFPVGFRHDNSQVNLSGKLKVLVSLLKNIRESKEKVVLVSHYTKTLDILEEMCKSFNFEYKRLDGGTQSKSRQQIVDQFNKNSLEFLFLLSSKAGGLGLNLQGASNIILYDIDWNPAHDIQAMGRCWRPGQTKETHIYRLLTGGTIEEKMYHRQITKMDLSGSVMDLLLGNSSIRFSPEELKDIFTFHESLTCLTHDLLECDCLCDGSNSVCNESFENIENTPPRKKKRGCVTSAMGNLSKWEHFGPASLNTFNDGLANSSTDIQFIFRSQSVEPTSQELLV